MSQLFIGPSCLGDAIIATGLVERMLADFPDAPITIACGPVAALVLRMTPRLEHVHVMRKRGVAGHWLELWRAVAGRRWRRVVDMRRSAIPWMLRADARHIAPRARPGEHRVALAARTLGLPPLAPRVWLDDAMRAEATRLLPAGRPVLALGTGANWIPKTWPAERYAELVRRLVGRGGMLEGALVATVGSDDERAAARPVTAGLPAEQVLDGFGLPMPTAAAILEHCTLFVGNDSGMMHLAAASGARTVGLFGPTDDVLYAPWGHKGLVVRTPEKLPALLAQIRRDGEQRTLMASLAVEDVLAAIAHRWPSLDPAPNAPVPVACDAGGR